jgi:hypothetical protein
VTMSLAVAVAVPSPVELWQWCGLTMGHSFLSVDVGCSVALAQSSL